MPKDEKVDFPQDEKPVYDSVKNYKWREIGVDGNTREIPMIVYDRKKLEKCLDVCHSMLHNRDSKHPGRLMVLEEIEKQKRNCNIMLFLRWIKKNFGKPELVLYEDLNSFVNNNIGSYPDIGEWKMSECVMGNCPNEFRDVTIDEIRKACTNSLGMFDGHRISKRFIAKIGLKISDNEWSELTPTDAERDAIVGYYGKAKLCYSKGKLMIDRLEVIKARYELDFDTGLYLNPAGISYTEFKELITMKARCWYADMTTVQLTVLRDKVLDILIDEVNKHIRMWNRKVKEIMEVASYQGFQGFRTDL